MADWCGEGTPGKFAPVASKNLKGMARDGRLSPFTKEWKGGIVPWMAAMDVGGLAFPDGGAPADKNRRPAPGQPPA